MCLIQMGTLTQDEMLESIRIFGEQVIPHFRALDAIDGASSGLTPPEPGCACRTRLSILSIDGHRQLRHDLEPVGRLVVGQAARARTSRSSSSVGGSAGSTGSTKATPISPMVGAGVPTIATRATFGWSATHALHLERMDVEAAADVHLAGAARAARGCRRRAAARGRWW